MMWRQMTSRGLEGTRFFGFGTLACLHRFPKEVSQQSLRMKLLAPRVITCSVAGAAQRKELSRLGLYMGGACMDKNPNKRNGFCFVFAIVCSSCATGCV